MLKTYKYPQIPDQDKEGTGNVLLGVQDGESITPLTFSTGGNNSAIISFTAVKFNQYRKEVDRITLATSLIAIDLTNNIYKVDGLTDYTTALDNGVYRFEFQNNFNLWKTEYFKVIDFVSPPFPAVIEDGNTVAWYLSDELSTITKDVSDFVSVWADKLASGNDLLQAIGARQPKWFLNLGVLFDGATSFMKTLSFLYNQPEQIYIVFTQLSWSQFDYIFDGDAGDSGILFREAGLPINNMAVYAGITSAQKFDVVLTTPIIARVLFNGASSTFQFNNSGELTGNWGASNMGGFSLGGRAIYNTTTLSNMYVKEVILRDVADSPSDEQDIYNYLKSKYSI